jgi:hypothetical protein
MNDSPSLLEACDRTRSNEARSGLRSILWEPVTATNALLPENCPLAPAVDVLLWQEKTKKRISSTHWRCGLCGKTFRSEYFLDKHLARKHPTAGPEESSADYGVQKVCLADLCGISVPCLPTGNVRIPPVSAVLVRQEDFALASGESSRHANPETITSVTPRICTDAVEHMAAKHSCFEMIEKCITPETHSSEAELVRLRTTLHGALCDDAYEVECAGWSEKLAWRAHLQAEGHLSFRHVLGCILLLLTCVVYAIGRYASRLRRGEDDFTRPRRRLRHWVRRSLTGKSD